MAVAGPASGSVSALLALVALIPYPHRLGLIFTFVNLEMEGNACFSAHAKWPGSETSATSASNAGH
jgi:hypothetical protein